MRHFESSAEWKSIQDTIDKIVDLMATKHAADQSHVQNDAESAEPVSQPQEDTPPSGTEIYMQ